MRAFVAIELPGEISLRLAELDPKLPGLRWTASGRQHLTLCFLGTIDGSVVESLRTGLDRIRQEAFPLGVRGVGCFGGKRGRPLVIWAGIEDPCGALNRLHASVTAAVRAAGLDPDGKRFRPHLTLGRAKRLGRAELRDFLDANAGRDLGRFEVGGFALFSSVLRPEGAEHHVKLRVTFDPPLGSATSI